MSHRIAELATSVKHHLPVRACLRWGVGVGTAVTVGGWAEASAVGVELLVPDGVTAAWELAGRGGGRVDRGSGVRTEAASPASSGASLRRYWYDSVESLQSS